MARHRRRSVPSSQLSVWLDLEIETKPRILADRHHRSVSHQIRYILSRYIERHLPSPPLTVEGDGV
jgi:hypothetical protein